MTKAVAIALVGILTPATAIGLLRGFDASVGTSPIDAVLLLASMLVGFCAGSLARRVGRREVV